MASSREKEDEMTLYYHPALYFSQRIALVLEEKGLKYKTKFVNSQTGEHMSQWYREINPQGEVPSISCNGYNVGDSERLLDYLDKVFPRTPRLQPPDYTSEGQKVRYWRSKINSIPVEFITLGCIMFRSKLTRGSSIPENVPRHLPDQIGLVRDHFRHQFRGHLHGAQTSDDDDDEETELDVYGTVVRDINNVREQIGVLDMVLEEIESELGKTRLMYGTNQEHWLISRSFTAADVYLGVLLNRVEYAGLAYHFQGSMPLLTDYYVRLCQRATYRKAVVNIPSVIFRLIVIPAIVKKIKRIAPFVLGVGLVIAAVVLGYKYIPP